MPADAQTDPPSCKVIWRELVELVGIELEPFCGRLSPQAKS
jgi:hypothetical protein